jgi:CheY-like chemotaxis protein
MLDPDQEVLRIAINDNGGGIPEDAIGLIFHPFFTTKDVGKGTGLGLSVSYGIVEGMGGHIDVRNEGDGACFEIVLPATHIGETQGDENDPSDDAPLLPQQEKVPEARSRDLRIMVVDDEIDAMEIIAAYLEAQGFSVSAASDGEDALALAGVVQPDILITDIRMPQMDGNSLVRELRSRNPALPVIVMTGHPGDADRPTEDGDDAPVMVMAKPLDLKELLATLDEISEVVAG